VLNRKANQNMEEISDDQENISDTAFCEILFYKNVSDNLFLFHPEPLTHEYKTGAALTSHRMHCSVRHIDLFLIEWP